MKKIILYILFFSSFLAFCSQNERVIKYQNSTKLSRIGKYLSFYEDTSNQLSIKEISKLPFTPCINNTPNFGFSKSTYWVKFTLENLSNTEEFLLEFNRIYAKELSLYYQVQDTSSFLVKNYNENSKKHIGRLFLFEFSIPKSEKITFYIKLKTTWSYSFPIKISPQKNAFKQLFHQELIGGIYLGIILIMVCYNFIIFSSVRDKSYLYYVVYIASFFLFQLNELGYAYKYYWYLKPYLFHIFTKVTPILSCITAIYFVRDFLKTKHHTPKLHKIYNYFIIGFICVLFTITNNKYNEFYYTIFNVIAFSISIFTLIVAIVILKKGFSPAKFFLIAWSILLLSIIQYTLSNLDIIPYFSFTRYSLEIGSIIEIVLLSFGLTYRINVLMKEKEKSQALALELAKENELIITQENQKLEELVNKRTNKLALKNIQILGQNEEKSTMMREIHHRVKNNLQMINSMIRMQSKFVNSSDSKDVLNKVQRRIIVMAQLHEKMYLSKDLKSIRINSYLTNMISDIFKNDENDNSFILNISEELEFNTENALSVGLLINELINYTLPQVKNDIINIEIKEVQKNEFILTFFNKNKGISYSSLMKKTSLTQRLTLNFIKQLNGSIPENQHVNNEHALVVKFDTL
ncbi:7TM diverse intracellular signaling domain-containing protein [Pseudofulvibacter geojedonensis]|uniref:histidine kinase n=1 Tax=Pseudofulvibacter geojedonensis TaxID=1123758 RepID=A0ABW3HYS1_9FLAO